MYYSDYLIIINSNIYSTCFIWSIHLSIRWPIFRRRFFDDSLFVRMLCSEIHWIIFFRASLTIEIFLFFPAYASCYEFKDVKKLLPSLDRECLSKWPLCGFFEFGINILSNFVGSFFANYTNTLISILNSY